MSGRVEKKRVDGKKINAYSCLPLILVSSQFLLLHLFRGNFEGDYSLLTEF
jgi:hypothetical protein